MADFTQSQLLRHQVDTVAQNLYHKLLCSHKLSAGAQPRVNEHTLCRNDDSPRRLETIFQELAKSLFEKCRVWR